MDCVKERLDELSAYYGSDIQKFFHMSLKHKYVYVVTPKVGTTTIKHRLNLLEIKGTPIDPDRIPLHPSLHQSILIRPYQLSTELLELALWSKDYFRFAFVRHPFERLLSAYLDKIYNGKPEKKLVSKYLKQDIDEDISFEQFIEYLEYIRDEDKKLDPHWRPQFSILRPDIINYNLIGKMDSFEEDFAKLNAYLGNKLDCSVSKTPHKTGARAQLNEFFTSDIKKRVIDLYQPDFDYFEFKP